MKSNPANLICASLLLLPVLAPSSSRAVALDWNSVTWSAGTLTKSFDIDPSHAGNDITVTLSLSTGAAFQSNNPAISSTFSGGLPSTNKALGMNIDLANTAAYVHVTINFLYAGGVSNAQFSMFDVDNSTNGSWQDQVRNFSGKSIANSTLSATNVTGASGNSVTYSAESGYTATGTSNIVNTGAGSQNANVNVSYGQNYLKSVSFDYGSGSNASADPSAEGIALGKISFNPTASPEINPSAGAALGCLAAFGLYFWRKRSGGRLACGGSLPA